MSGIGTSWIFSGFIAVFETPVPFFLFSLYYLVYNLVGGGGVIRDVPYVLKQTARSSAKWLAAYAAIYASVSIVFSVDAANELLLVFLFVFILRRYRAEVMHRVTASFSLLVVGILWIIPYHPAQVLTAGTALSNLWTSTTGLAVSQPLLTLSTVIGSSTLLFAYLGWKSSVLDDQWEIDQSLHDRLLGIDFPLNTDEGSDIFGTITQVRVVEKQNLGYNLRKYFPRGEFEGFAILVIDFQSRLPISEGQLRRQLSHTEGVHNVRLSKPDRVLLTLDVTRPLVVLEDYLASVQSAIESSLSPPKDKKLGHGVEMISTVEYHYADSLRQRLKYWRAERLLDFLDHNTFPEITVEKYQNGHSPPRLIVRTDLGQSEYPRPWPHETGGVSIFSALESVRHAYNDAHLTEGAVKQYENGEEYATFEVTIRSRRMRTDRESNYEIPVVNFQIDESGQFTFYNSTAEMQAREVELFSITERGVDADFIAIEDFAVYVYYSIGEQELNRNGEGELYYLRMKWLPDNQPELAVIRESGTYRDDRIVWYHRDRYLGRIEELTEESKEESSYLQGRPQ